jgi:hypothetical protein
MTRPNLGNLLLVFAAGTALLLRCAALDPGTGSETTNGYVTGRLLYDNGSPAPNVRVMLLPVLHNPRTGGPVPDSLMAFTNTEGAYRIAFPNSGFFNIEAALPAQAGNVLITGIASSGDAEVPVPQTWLKPPGAIKIILPDIADARNGYVYIPGTTIWAGVANGQSMLHDVPAGFIPAVYYADSADSTRNRVIRTNVTVASYDTTEIADYRTWKYSKQVFLNTAASGANIASSCTNVPVLIRLTAGNFNFSEAKRSGADLRFTKSDDTPLPCEIEQWDSAGGAATVWVRMDTVYGNSSTRYFLMYWGNPAAQTNSNPAAVFSTADAFLAVWHLDEPANTAQNGYRDATAGGYHLTSTGATPSVQAVIGNGRGFDSTLDYLYGTAPEKLNGNSDFTVMFWIKSGAMKPENVQDNRVDILDFGQKFVPKSVFHVLLWPNYTAQMGFEDGFEPAGSIPDSTTRIAQNVFNFSNQAGVWTFVTTVYEAQTRLLSTYVNGSLRDRDTATGVNLQNSGGLRMGLPYFASDVDFIGSLDEVRICGRPLTAEEVRLNYEIQKLNSTLAKFQRL